MNANERNPSRNPGLATAPGLTVAHAVGAILWSAVFCGAIALPQEPDYRPEYAAGLVTIRIGDNRLSGGSNRVEGGPGFSFPIMNATLTIDGQTAIRDGKLTL